MATKAEVLAKAVREGITLREAHNQLQTEEFRKSLSHQLEQARNLEELKQIIAVFINRITP